MPVTDSFLAACRSAISSLPELTTFRATLASVGVGGRDQRAAAWASCYEDSKSHDKSPAYRLRKAVRDAVQAQADIAGTLSPLDRESAYRAMAAEFAPPHPKPPTTARESEELQRLLLEDQLS